MRITALVENTSKKSDIINKHGLSLYIKTNNHKILFDLGPDDTIFKNAETLGVDLSKVDAVVISHGHSDHGGALGLFLKQNEKADVYIQERAFDGCAVAVMGMKFNVGLDDKLKDSPKIKLVSGVTEIDKELTIFSDVAERRFPLKGNEKLYVKTDGKYVHDDFVHEQHLMIRDNGKTTVISGCSHQGIVNIKQRADVLAGGNIDYMIAGMHLYDPAGRKYEKQELIESVADELSKGNTRFYTCHCTGEKAVDIMRNRLHERLKYLSAGESIEL